MMDMNDDCCGECYISPPGKEPIGMCGCDIGLCGMDCREPYEDPYVEEQPVLHEGWAGPAAPYPPERGR